MRFQGEEIYGGQSAYGVRVNGTRMSYIIIKADLKKDKEIIMSLCTNNLSEMTEKRYSWKYENNPYGPAECWLVKHTEQNTIIGTAALFPRGMIIQGEFKRAGIAGDFAISKNYRSLGPALLLQKKVVTGFRDSNFDILYGVPNSQSAPVLIRIGYKVIGNNVWMSKPIKSYNFLRYYISSSITLKILSKPVDVIIKYLSRESYYKKPETFTFEVITSFDKRFDDLWEKVSDKYTIIGERKSHYLNWKFLQNPCKNYDIFALTQKKTNELLGYIVSHTTENRALIVDILTLNLNEIFDSLLSEFILFQRKKGVESISIIYFGSEDFEKKLKKYLFFVTNRETKLLGYMDTGSPIYSFTPDKNNWYLLEGDEDI